jgi:hypothetical protein
VTDVALLVLLAGVDGAARPVIVESATTCPTGAEVEARLRVLLPPATDDAPARHARLVAEDGSLRVQFGAADGAVLGDRTVAVEASCADRANVVAVVIAAWEAQQRAEEVQAPSLPRRAPPTVIATPSPPPAPAPSVAVELVVGPSVTLAGGGLSPAAAVALSLWGPHVGARLALSGFAPRTEPLGAGSVRWTRATASLELGARLRGRAGRLDAHAGAVAAVVAAQGTGFDVDHQVTQLAPGIGLGVDASRTFGHFLVGVGTFAAAFNALSVVDTTADKISHPLPRLQVSLDLHAGMAF